MKRFAIVAALALSLGGCAGSFQNLQNAWDVVTGTKLSDRAVYVAANSADSGEIVATSYLKACHKAPTAYAACAKSIEYKVVDAVRNVRTARRDLRAFLVAHPDALGAAGVYDAVKLAQSDLSKIITDYNLGAVK